MEQTPQQLLAEGRFAEAYQAADLALASAPEDIALLIARANAAIGLRAPDKLIAALVPVIERRPNNSILRQRLAGAFNLRGCALSREQQWEAAKNDFQLALEQYPEHAEAWFNLALAQRALDQPTLATKALQRHLSVMPKDSQARLILASLESPEAARQQLSKLGNDADTLDQGWLAYAAARAGALDQCVEALMRVGPNSSFGVAQDALTELRLRGQAAKAQYCAPHLTALARENTRCSSRSELIGRLALPAIYPDRHTLDEWRARFTHGLEALQSDWSALQPDWPKPRLTELAHSNFLLAYQGLDDRKLQADYGRLIQTAVRLHFPKLHAPTLPGTGKRVGLLSSLWRNSTVGSYFACWIDWLGQMGLETVLYQLGPQRDPMTDQLAAKSSQFRFLSGSLDAIAEQVREDRLDLLILPEVGMDARIPPLLACRLAARVAVGWGHPVTTGFTGVNAYFSVSSMECDDAGTHYVEPLRLLEGLGVDYRRPVSPHRASRSQLGLPDKRPTVLVPQSLFKLHPDFDWMMVRLVESLPDVVFILFEPEYPEWRTDYLKRLQSNFAVVGAEVGRHIRFLPRANREIYLQINQACDLMLDSLHWSGGNTAIDALHSGLPIVTVAGPLMRSRQTHAMLGRIGLQSELSCESPELAVELCHDLLTNKQALETLSHLILDRRDALFEAKAAERSFQQEISSLLETPLAAD